jgi:hypothetical protein
VNIGELHRREYRRILASLIRVVKEFDLAEDALQAAIALLTQAPSARETDNAIGFRGVQGTPARRPIAGGLHLPDHDLDQDTVLDRVGGGAAHGQAGIRRDLDALRSARPPGHSSLVGGFGVACAAVEALSRTLTGEEGCKSCSFRADHLYRLPFFGPAAKTDGSM